MFFILFFFNTWTSYCLKIKKTIIYIINTFLLQLYFTDSLKFAIIELCCLSTLWNYIWWLHYRKIVTPIISRYRVIFFPLDLFFGKMHATKLLLFPSPVLIAKLQPVQYAFLVRTQLLCDYDLINQMKRRNWPQKQGTALKLRRFLVSCLMQGIARCITFELGQDPKPYWEIKN